MKASDFPNGSRVYYSGFPDEKEFGTVSSANEKFVFVKFDKNVALLGWDGCTSQACNPSDLTLLDATLQEVHRRSRANTGRKVGEE